MKKIIGITGLMCCTVAIALTYSFSNNGDFDAGWDGSPVTITDSVNDDFIAESNDLIYGDIQATDSIAETEGYSSEAPAADIEEVSDAILLSATQVEKDPLIRMALARQAQSPSDTDGGSSSDLSSRGTRPPAIEQPNEDIAPPTTADTRSHLTANDMPNDGVVPSIDGSSWELKLVNHANPLAADFKPTTGVTKDGYLFDTRAISALDDFLSAGRAQGYQLQLCSAYRSYASQQKLFNEKVSNVKAAMGLAGSAAEAEAAKSVARPGDSEHQLGLAADIISLNYTALNDGYGNTPEAKWLRENCARYGFILRYAKDKQDITGIIYEPWHFRYVGVEAATYIMNNNLCLEEYLLLNDSATTA